MILNRINYLKREFALLLLSVMLVENYALAKLNGYTRVEFANKANNAAYGKFGFHTSLPHAFVNTGTKSKPYRVNSRNSKRSPEIGGPGQPEMQSFQPTGVSNMVDLFTGDFSYNIPLMDVGGYPVNIHYNSGINMDQDASWVGLGWNINPGTINRNMRGLPDDFNGADTVTKTLSIKNNITFGITGDFNPEIIGKELKLAKTNLSIEYNNYTGIGLSVGISPTINSSRSTEGNMTSTFSTELNLSLGSKSGVDVGASTSFTRENNSINDKMIGYNSSSVSGSLNFNSRRGLTDLQIIGSHNKKAFHDDNTSSSRTTSISFARTSYTPSIDIPFTSFQFSLRVKAGAELFGFHPLGALGGFYSQQYIAKDDQVRKLPAYGFLNFQKANDKSEVLLDYNRESDNTYSKNLPHIAIPVYTNDVFSVSGEGMAGTFRAYRGDVGYIRDTKMKTKNHSGAAAVDFGGGNLIHGGADLTYNYSYTETNEWVKQNSLRGIIKFRDADTTFEPVYFRNPGEKTINARDYYKAIGGDALVRVNLGGGVITPQATNFFTKFNDQKRSIGVSTITRETVKKERDKRTQVFTYLTAEEASVVGLDSMISIYPENKFFADKCSGNLCDLEEGNCDTIVKEQRVNDFRKSNHISEVQIVNPDGKRYIYGIPAYNTRQSEVTFSVDKNNGNLTTGLVSFTNGSENNPDNNRAGKDNYYSKEELPAYAHSYLLTGLVSSDYVDVKGDGISDDDIGDAVKFNYSRIFSKQNPYKWRAPFGTAANQASYNESLRTDKSDDKGSYTYGEKEIWYLNSIESKTMFATFTLNSVSEPRRDGLGSGGENGGKDNNQKLRFLKQIDLYSKADFIKNGMNAKPVKTVHFVYSYKLCKGNPGSDISTNGKLTLDSIWFSYNGNKKGKKNPYVFTYHNTNPDYNSRNSDRWGNYKNADDNPGGMLNSEFPYALQDSTLAANNAAAWCLQRIKLPSGAVIKVDYESDDYAFVQNRRVTQMFQVAGFAQSSSAAWDAITTSLYVPRSSQPDNAYMFLQLPSDVSTKQELFEKYLMGLPDSKLYFRMSVKMPADSYGSGNEFVSGYARWDDYGLVGVGTTNKVWIKLKEVKNMNPVTKAALQFLRLHLPSKAYPGSDVKEDLPAKAAIKVLGGMISSISQLLFSFDGSSKLKGWCNTIDPAKSIVRLANPAYKKFGGGHRVKRVLIYDNWNAMTGQKESYYGQQYDYTTTEVINGKRTIISSGVATYEPTIGNDENPFHVAMEYNEQSSILAPTFGRYIDNPVGESYYPSATVGYSKVKVSSVSRKNLRSANGYEESEFFTSRDFPVYSDFTPFDGDSKRQFRSPLRFLLRIDLRHYLTLSQGFRVELNDMNGKLKSKTVYAENDTLNPISYTRNFYQVQGENTSMPRLHNKVSVVETTSGAINTDAEIGKDIEMVVDMRQQVSETWGVNVELNNDFFIIPTPIPIPVNLPSFIPVPNHDLKQYRSVTALKIINRYGILDSVIVIEKGSKLSVKNLLYDAEAGDVVLSRTQNEFDDPVYSFSYPAYQAYDALGLAYKNVGAVFNNISLTNGKLSNTAYEKFFVSGDEVFLKTAEGNKLCGSYYQYSNDKVYKLWAIDGTKISKPAGIYFIDRYGKLFTSINGNMKILRSGRHNLLGEVGSVVSLASPIVPDGAGKYKLLFDNATKVINASAAEYKENWKVEDRFYTKDTSYITTFTNTIFPSEIVTKRCMIKRSNGTDGTVLQTLGDADFPPYINTYVIAAFDYIGNNGGACNTNDYSFSYYAKTALRFNFDNIPKNSVLNAAYFTFSPTMPNNPTLFNREQWSMGGLFCGTKYSFNWGGSNNFFNFYNNNLLYSMRRITSQWGQTTPFNNFAVVSTNKININQSNYQNVDCKQLINDFLLNPSYGLMFEVTDQNGNSPTSKNVNYLGSAETNYLNFCAISFPGGHGLPGCGGISLNLNYSIITTETLCRSSLTQTSSNPYVMGYLGNWRPYRSYTYFDDRNETDPTVLTNIRTDGAFKSFAPFWSYGSTGLSPVYDTTKWVWNSEITKINRKGMEVENKDPLGRYNSGLYGYNMTLPVAVAQNSQYKEIAFDGFEDYGYKNTTCAKPCSTYNHFNLPVNTASDLSTAEKHSGKYSLKVNAGYSFGMLTDIPLIRASFDTLQGKVNVTTDTTKKIINVNQTDKYCYDAVHTDSSNLLPRYSPVPGRKIVVGAWVKEAKDCNCESYVENNITIRFKLANGTFATFTLKPSGNIIEGWQRIDSAITVPANTVAYNVQFTASPNSITYFDDFRIQPFNSNMKTFVYNPVNLRLMAELDENNYASFYEYDDEGTLIRVKKETEKGIKTIKETRSALLKQ